MVMLVNAFLEEEFFWNTYHILCYCLFTMSKIFSEVFYN